jgi:hypothetical protein
VPQIVITSYVATGIVGAIGLAMLSVSLEVGWILCAGTVGTLLLVTMMLKKMDVRRPEQAGIVPTQSGGRKAA